MARTSLACFLLGPVSVYAQIVDPECLEIPWSPFLKCTEELDPCDCPPSHPIPKAHRPPIIDVIMPPNECHEWVDDGLGDNFMTIVIDAWVDARDSDRCEDENGNGIMPYFPEMGFRHCWSSESFGLQGEIDPADPTRLMLKLPKPPAYKCYVDHQITLTVLEGPCIVNECKSGSDTINIRVWSSSPHYRVEVKFESYVPGAYWGLINGDDYPLHAGDPNYPAEFRTRQQVNLGVEQTSAPLSPAWVDGYPYQSTQNVNIDWLNNLQLYGEYTGFKKWFEHSPVPLSACPVDPNAKLWSSGVPDWLNACGPFTAFPDSGLRMDFLPVGNKTKVIFHAAADNTCSTKTSVNAWMQVAVEKEDPCSYGNGDPEIQGSGCPVTYTVYGFHTGFPAFDVSIGGNSVYAHTPCPVYNPDDHGGPTMDVILPGATYVGTLVLP